MDRIFEYKSSRRYSIPYRIIRSNQTHGDGSIVWFLEYAQNPKRPNDWGPRGVVLERDGKWLWGGKEYGHPYEALMARVAEGP